MSSPLYKITFSGSPLSGTSMQSAKTNLAAFLKASPDTVESLFSGRHVALKRNLPRKDAEKYVQRLRDSGIDARLEEERPIPPFESHLPGADSPYAPPRANVGAPLPAYGDLKVFSLQGRIGRVRYLAWTFVLVLLALPALFVAGIFMGVSEGLGWVAMIAVGATFMLVSVQIGVQRLHDLGWSGWLWLLNLVPVVNSVFPLLMAVIPGNREANRYGAPPPPNTGTVKLLAWMWIAMLLVAGVAGSLVGYFDPRPGA